MCSRPPICSAERRDNDGAWRDHHGVKEIEKCVGPKGERRKCQGPRTILLDRPRSSPFADGQNFEGLQKRYELVTESQKAIGIAGKELAKRFIACVSHDVPARLWLLGSSWQFGTASREPLEAAFRAFFSASSFWI